MNKQKQQSIRRLIQQLRKVNHRQLDGFFHQAHEEVFAHTDCMSCANCCKTTGPMLIDKDVERLSKRMRMRAAEFEEKYLRKDEDGDLVFKSMPCPFLGSDNFCLVYDERPKACREFPHTDRSNMYQLLDLTEKNAAVCPAVEEILDKMAIFVPEKGKLF